MEGAKVSAGRRSNASSLLGMLGGQQFALYYGLHLLHTHASDQDNNAVRTIQDNKNNANMHTVKDTL